MAKEATQKFDRSKPHINIGGIGHVDHGKTTLIAAITKYLAGKNQAKFKDYSEIDKAPEERKRGITISTSHIEFETEKRHYTWIDCPGHQDYVKNMITGASEMDGAIVVVSAGDSVKEQTKEHLRLAKQSGINHLVVFINKIDTISEPEIIEMAEADVRENLAKYGYDGENTPVVKGSALCALEERKLKWNDPQRGEVEEEGSKAISDLLEAIDIHIPIPEWDKNAPFKMEISGVVDVSGQGAIVTGVVKQGILKKGDEVTVIGENVSITTVATSIEMHNKELEEAIPGYSVGIKLRGVERAKKGGDKKKQVSRGQVVIKTPKKGEGANIKPYSKFVASAYILTKDEGGRHTTFKSGYRPQFYFGSADVTGTITLSKDEVVEPGKEVNFTVELTKAMPLEERQKFIIRESNHTIGQGTVIELVE